MKVFLNRHALKRYSFLSESIEFSIRKVFFYAAISFFRETKKDAF